MFNTQLIRAWDVIEKKMLYRKLCDMNWYNTEKNDEDGCHTARSICQTDQHNLIMMRGTGWLDSTGQQIYEGDIVHYQYGEKEGIGIVSWIDDFKLCCNPGFGIYTREGQYDAEVSFIHCKIIHNTFEAREELLKEKTNE